MGAEMNTRRVIRPLFNTPVESGLRTLHVLAALSPDLCDLQRLVIYDHLLVHSTDVPSGPPALHPATPLRSGEILVRRQAVDQGLRLLIHKGLVKQQFKKSGIYFATTEIARPFLEHFHSEYAERCAEISKWIAKIFQPMSDKELRIFIYENLGRWGTEFTSESVLGGKNE